MSISVYFRFVYDGNTGGVQKLMKAVQFTVDLEIPKVKTKQSSKYRNRKVNRRCHDPKGIFC
jgi:hypothetical protein